ncbi:MAG: hypothetical protein IKZ95_01600 [Lachnospiraceae bacterium]|nr:hypothetical protein [Lachnospiraceae bacterium]
MPTWFWIVIGITAVVAVVCILLIVFGKRTEKKQKQQEAEMQRNAQPMSFYIIDKKKMRLKNAGLPKVVYDNVPKMAKIWRMPILKVKVGNRVMNLICDDKVYKTLLPKQEVKAQVSGMYVISAKRVRGPIAEQKKRGKDGKVKESFIDRLR